MACETPFRRLICINMDQRFEGKEKACKKSCAKNVFPDGGLRILNFQGGDS
jgi:hypothetical protein